MHLASVMGGSVIDCVSTRYIIQVQIQRSSLMCAISRKLFSLQRACPPPIEGYIQSNPYYGISRILLNSTLFVRMFPRIHVHIGTCQQHSASSINNKSKVILLIYNKQTLKVIIMGLDGDVDILLATIPGLEGCNAHAARILIQPFARLGSLFDMLATFG